MGRLIRNIVPFVIVTLVCIGAVETLYHFVDGYLRVGQGIVPVKSQVAKGKSKAGAVSSPEQMKAPDYSIIVKRNLFQSYAKEAQTAAGQGGTSSPDKLNGLEATSLDLVLYGTVAGSPGERRAFIQSKEKNGQQDIYYQGDVVEGAVIREILRGKVILTYQGKDQILDMSKVFDSISSSSGGGVSSPSPFLNRAKASASQPHAPARKAPPRKAPAAVRKSFTPHRSTRDAAEQKADVSSEDENNENEDADISSENEKGEDDEDVSSENDSDEDETMTSEHKGKKSDEDEPPEEEPEEEP